MSTEAVVGCLEAPQIDWCCTANPLPKASNCMSIFERKHWFLCCCCWQVAHVHPYCQRGFPSRFAAWQHAVAVAQQRVVLYAELEQQRIKYGQPHGWPVWHVVFVILTSHTYHPQRCSGCCILVLQAVHPMQQEQIGERGVSCQLSAQTNALDTVVSRVSPMV